MKSLNLTGSQAEIVVKSLNERLYEFDEELDALESRIIEIRMKKSQLINLLAELGASPTDVAAPKKRGRKPGSGKKAAAKTATEDAAPKKRGRKPGSGKKAAAKTAEPNAAPKKRGRKPGSGKKAAAKVAEPNAAPKKRGRKPGSGKKAAAKVATPSAAPKKRGRKPGSGKKATVKVAAPKKAAKVAKKASAKKAATKVASKGKKAVETKVAAIAPAAPAKKAAKVAAKKAEAGKRGRKSGGENTLASKIVSAITDAKKGLSTREIVDAINAKYGAEKDERKLIQAISSTLISLTKRGKIKRENTSDGQILNNVVS